MRLKYLKGEKIEVKWLNTKDSTMFTPLGECSDELGQRLLDNKDYIGWFRKVEVFRCETCGKECKTKIALGAHKKTHKGKQDETVNS